ncbi:MAG: hypothetical protein ACRETD_07270, partial [Steroidobacteraceae bacterium]
VATSTLFPVRNYTRADIEAEWLMTPVFFIKAGYEFTWQKFSTDTNSAANHSFSIGIGYQALKRRP